jgi:arylsulfatase A-like enzyme
VNVIFISMDTLRADRLGCLGNERNLTPNLDRIAREGALFTRAFASDIPTQPAHTAIFTGRYGVKTGIVSHFHPEAQLDLSVPWLPSLFQSMGYATGAVDHLFAMKDWFVRGYTDYMPPPGRSRAPASVILDLGRPWLQAHHGDDFFLFLHFWDAHIPYVPPQPYKDRYTRSSGVRRDALVGDWLRSRPSYALFERNHYRHLDAIPNLDYIADLYDAEVAYLDHEIGRLFSHLGDLGVLENTLVVLFGDHGENMTEHDAWFDHAGLYDSVTQVPLIIWAPGTVPACEVSSLISMVDIKPTVLELLSLSPDLGMDGRSLVGLMRGQAENHRDVVYLSECTWQAKRGVRTDEWKYIRCIDPGIYPRTEPELYHVLDDPTEQENLATQFPEIAAEMDTLLSSWLDEQLAGRADPVDAVVRAGLPAVRRLQGVIAENAAEAAAPARNGASSEEAVAHP